MYRRPADYLQYKNARPDYLKEVCSVCGCVGYAASALLLRLVSPSCRLPASSPLPLPFLIPLLPQVWKVVNWKEAGRRYREATGSGV